MSDSVEVSIIVPVYNAEHYLDRCVNSIKRQTSHEWEAIMVNDGSTDGSLEKLRNLCGEDSRFRIISKRNGGVASARNVGINAARTEYITFVDVDDSIADRYVECMLNKIDEEQCDLVISRIRKNGVDLFFPLAGFRKFEPYYFFKYFDGGPCAKLFKKKLIDKYDIRFPEDMKVAEDFVFTASYAIHINSFCGIDDALYIYYYDNEESLMHKFWKGTHDLATYCFNIEAPWRVYKSLLEYKSECKNVFSAFAYAMYRHLWIMYYASHKYISATQKESITSFFKEKHYDFKKNVGLLRRIFLPARYPRLRKLVRWLKHLISSVNLHK